MKALYLADLKGMSEEDIRAHIISAYSGEYSSTWARGDREVDRDALKKELEDFDILIGYESVGSWGCDSSSFFLFRHKETAELFENHGSHCSCYGFEGQWEPEKTTLKYLSSDKFYLPTGGYDFESDENAEKVIEYIKNLKESDYDG